MLCSCYHAFLFSPLSGQRVLSVLPAGLQFWEVMVERQSDLLFCLIIMVNPMQVMCAWDRVKTDSGTDAKKLTLHT